MPRAGKTHLIGPLECDQSPPPQTISVCSSPDGFDYSKGFKQHSVKRAGLSKGGFILVTGATCFCLPPLFIVDFFFSPSHTHTLSFLSVILSLPRSLGGVSCAYSPPAPPLPTLESLTFSLPSVPLSHSDARLYIWPFCRDSLAPGGFSWNQFTLPVPSH